MRVHTHTRVAGAARMHAPSRSKLLVNDVDVKEQGVGL